jgi:hypothetical protein
MDIINGDNAHRLSRIYHEGETIKELRRALDDPAHSKYTYDEIVMVVHALALDAGPILPPINDSPFDTPLSGVAWVNKRGRIKNDERHNKALCDLVEMRGGLKKVKLPYVASTISM